MIFCLEKQQMVGSVPRRYLVLVTLTAFISALLTILFLAIPTDPNLVIQEPFHHPQLSPSSPSSPLPPAQDPITNAAPIDDAPAPSPTPASKDDDEAKKKELEKEREKAKGDKKTKDKPAEFKYFYEAGGGYELVHYDKRFFVDKVPYEEHLVYLRLLIRSYLTFMEDAQVETWIAHGSLLGWWWNQRIMPWDYDLDVQVRSETLEFLGENYNMTLHSFDIAELEPTVNDEEAGPEMELVKRMKPTKSYVLDINPNSVNRSRMKGLNVIDARWIDVENGMFIDITGLTELDPLGKPGVLSCKNNHHYKTDVLFPLKETEFEGIKAMIPAKVETILKKEYGDECLVKTEFEGHRWDQDLKLWVKIEGHWVP